MKLFEFYFKDKIISKLIKINIPITKPVSFIIAHEIFNAEGVLACFWRHSRQKYYLIIQKTKQKGENFIIKYSKKSINIVTTRLKAKTTEEKTIR